jgi:MFS family permease
MAAGLLLAAVGTSAAAPLPGVAGAVCAAVILGAGAGVITPLGFAHLAATSPPDRLGQTMGAAELGRELGDAGGPILVGTVATAATLGAGLLALAALLACLAAAIILTARKATLSSP